MTINAQCGQPIMLGWQTENMVEAVLFDKSAWIAEFGPGAFQLVHKRRGDAEALPVAIEVSDGIVRWNLTAGDVLYRGNGEAQLRYYNEAGQIKASEIYQTRVERSLVSDPTVPEPMEGWVEQVIAAAASAELSRQGAETAEDGAQAAESAAEAWATGGTGGTPSATNNAKYYAEQAGTASAEASDAQSAAETAQGKAEDAQSAAELAQEHAEQSEANAAASAEAAAGSASAAATSASNAASSNTAAQSAKTAAETANTAAQAAKTAAEAAAASVSASAAQIATNTDNIADLKNAIIDEDNKINLLKVIEANTSSVTVTMETGKAISNKVDNVYNGNIVTSTNAAYCSIQVSAGECYFVTTRGGANYSAIAFFDSSTFNRYHYVGTNEYQTGTVALTDMFVLIPTGVTYMGVNTTNYADYPISIKKLNPTKSVDALYQAGYAYQDDMDRAFDEIDYVQDNLETLTEITTRPVFNPDTFDSVEEGIAYNAVNQSGTTWNSGHSYIKAVHTGEVYKISTTVVANSNYYAVLYYNNTTYLSGEVQGTSSQQPISNHEFTIPNNANKIIVCTYSTVTPVLTKEGIGPYVDTTVASVMQNYAIYDGTTLSVKCRYNSSEDLVVQMKRRGNNNLFDFDKVFAVDRSEILDTNISVSRQIFTTGTDSFSPYQIAALNNVDGDAESSFYTGGNHAHDDVATATCTDVSVYFDGKKSASFSGLCSNIRVSWTNLIQGWNTWKSDGTGRAILKEEITLDISGNQFNATVTITPLEDLSIKYYNGLQSVVSAYETILFVGGLNRERITVGTNENSGDLKSRRSVAVNNTTGDCMETFVANEDLGTFDLTGVLYSMFTQNNKVYYAIVRTTERQLDQDNVYCLFGHYRFYSK